MLFGGPSQECLFREILFDSGIGVEIVIDEIALDEAVLPMISSSPSSRCERAAATSARVARTQPRRRVRILEHGSACGEQRGTPLERTIGVQPEFEFTERQIDSP